MRVALAIALTLVLAVPATAAVTARTYYLKKGDSAVPMHAAIDCTAVTVRPYEDGFRCKVGGDYRGLHGVLITTQRLQVTRYTGFNRFRVVKTYRMVP